MFSCFRSSLLQFLYKNYQSNMLKKGFVTIIHCLGTVPQLIICCGPFHHLCKTCQLFTSDLTVFIIRVTTRFELQVWFKRFFCGRW